LAAALGADQAKGLAQMRLARLEAERTSATAHLSWRHARIRPGDRVRLDGVGGTWRVAQSRFEQMRLRLELFRVAGGVALAPATPGRPVQEWDLRHGATTLHLADLPPLPGLPQDRPALAVAAAGVEEGWRRAALSLSPDGGLSWRDTGTTAGAAVMGRLLTPFGASGSALIDEVHEAQVELLNAAMMLESRTDAELANGANLALLGEELIQFGRVEQVGARLYRLSHLLRGRSGTEWATPLHEPGEPFLLIDPDRLTFPETDPAMVGVRVKVLASGLGDGVDGVETDRLLTGEAMRPPFPVHLRAVRIADGDLAIQWTRRSRLGWRWSDGIDAPLGEEREWYRLALRDAAGAGRVVELGTPAFCYEVAMQASDGVTGPLTVEVLQLGTHAASRSATLTGM
jgi:hypothetical protein